MKLRRTSLTILAAQKEHHVAYPHGMVSAASEPHPQPEMIVHADQTGIARPKLFDQLADARHNAVAPWQMQLGGISGISVG